MEFLVVGLNHRTADVALREGVSFTEGQILSAMDCLLDQAINEVVILSTCGRCEVYFTASKAESLLAEEQVKQLFQNHSRNDGIVDHLYSKRGSDAIEHLIQVSLGLDSIVLGEDQIIGQMKNAHLLALEMGGSKKILNTLFRDGIAAAKRVKSQLKISEIPLSISRLGIGVLTTHFGCLAGKTCGLVGLGEMGNLALNYLLEAGASLTLCGRSKEKLKSMTDKMPDIKTLSFEDRYQLIENHDMIISATAAPHLIFEKAHFMKRLQPLVLLDLSLPRDIDEKVRELPNIVLYNMDDLQRLSEEHMEKRMALTQEALVFLQTDVEKMTQWLEAVKLDEAIKDLNLMIQEIETDTLTYLHQKLDLSHKERLLVDKALHSALKRTIRTPLHNIKRMSRPEDQDRVLQALTLLYHEGGSDDPSVS
jgi:glutamyl-tRNA reductase